MAVTKSQFSSSEQIVQKSRIIAAILSELGASQATIFVEGESSDGPFACQMSCDLLIPFRNSKLQIHSVPSHWKGITVTCCFVGHRIKFKTTRKADDFNLWELPEEVYLIDLRQERRWRFPENQYSCEVVGASVAVYGYAVDINKECVAIDFDTSYDLSIGSHYKIIARMVNTNRDVFFADCELLVVTGNNAEDCRAIFKIVNDKAATEEAQKRKVERYEVTSTSVALTGAPFADFKAEVDFEVKNISSGGLLLRQRQGNSDHGLVPGLILTAKHPEVSLIVIWENDGYFGCRPLLQGREALSLWYRFLEEVHSPNDRKVSVIRREFADLLTYSGLVKGNRRKPFGKDMAQHLITHPELASPLLIQHYYGTQGTNETDLHSSAKRIGDNTWFFGDGAALTSDAGSYNAMLDTFTANLTKLAKVSSLYPRYLTGIWHQNVQATKVWGMELARKSTTRLFSASNVSMKNITPDGADSRVKALGDESASNRFHIAGLFEPCLFEVIAGGDGTHPVLNAELGKLGPYHQTQSKIVVLPNDLYLVAHRVVTYAIWSNTGVTNSVFVLVPRGCSAQMLGQGLKSLAEDDLSFGTDDFLVIFDDSFSDDLDETIFPPDRRFYISSPRLTTSRNSRSHVALTSSVNSHKTNTHCVRANRHLIGQLTIWR